MGEAPSKYFFSLLKAKWAREYIRSLELEGGMVITDEEEIMLETQRHFQTLFTADRTMEDNRDGRANILKLITEKVTNLENIWLLCIPLEEEIDEIVRNFPKGKSSGADGVTYKFLQETWPFIKGVASRW